MHLSRNIPLCDYVTHLQSHLIVLLHKIFATGKHYKKSSALKSSNILLLLLLLLLLLFLVFDSKILTCDPGVHASVAAYGRDFFIV